MKVELSREELALESVELLPDRDTMQLIALGNAIAGNAASVSQSNEAHVDAGNNADVTVTQTNTSDITQSAEAYGGDFNLTLG